MSALDLSDLLYFFSLASSVVIIIMTFVHIHTPTSLSPKNYSRKKLSHTFFKSAKIKFFLRFSIAKIQPNPKEKSSDFHAWFSSR